MVIEYPVTPQASVHRGKSDTNKLEVSARKRQKGICKITGL